MKEDIKRTIKTIKNDFRVTLGVLKLAFPIDKRMKKVYTEKEKEEQLSYIKYKISEMNDYLSFENTCSIIKSNAIILGGIVVLDLLLGKPGGRNIGGTIHLNALAAVGIMALSKMARYEIRKENLEKELGLVEE